MVFKESLFKGKAARSHDQFFFKNVHLLLSYLIAIKILGKVINSQGPS